LRFPGIHLGHTKGARMIIDRLENLEHYQSVIPFFKEISDFLSQNTLHELETGRIDLVQDNVYLLIQELNTENEVDRLWESHENFLDIQIVLSGEERFGYANVDELDMEIPYDDKKDITRYKKEGEGLWFDLKPSMFCIFYPGEGHKPCCSAKESVRVKKAVFKVAIDHK
jgi:biofilm protein TabA